jgi:hypothetical protein
MPKSKNESLVYTVLMCTFMVFFMSVYNLSLHFGFSWETIQKAWQGFPLAFLIAILCDCFIVSGPAKKLAFTIIDPSSASGVKKIVAISTCMVCGMVLCMSLYGAVHSVGFSNQLLLAWLKAIPMNFMMALPLQLVIAGPIVRFLFAKVFPQDSCAGKIQRSAT